MRTLHAVALFAACSAFVAALAPITPVFAVDVAVQAVNLTSLSPQQAAAPVVPLSMGTEDDTATQPGEVLELVPTPRVSHADAGLGDGASIPDDLALDLTDLPGGKDSLLCLALNDYFEARGETLQGRVAVAKVVLNRAQDLRFPNTVCGVVFENHRMSTTNERVCQFSWHCDGQRDRPADTDVWRDSVLIAAAVLFGGDAIDDPTGGAMWYHTMAVRPPWAVRLQASAEIGAHLFYQDPNGGRPVTEELASVMQRLPSIEEINDLSSGD
jgi:hypothetical protein